MELYSHVVNNVCPSWFVDEIVEGLGHGVKIIVGGDDGVDLG